MEKQAFLEIMIFLEGAYARSFPQAVRDVAWGMFQTYDASIVRQAAVRMVEVGDERPSPVRLHQYVETIMRETFADRERQRMMAQIETYEQRFLAQTGPRFVAPPRRPDETDDERIACLKTLIGTEEEPGTARADDCREYIRLILAKPYPAGHMLA